MSVFQIRPAQGDDSESMLAIYAPYILGTAVTFEEEVPSAREFRERMAQGSSRFPWLVATDAQGEVIGYSYARPHRDRAAYRWACEVSLYIAESWQHRGVGRALYNELFIKLRLSHFFQALAGITMSNTNSILMHERVGFKLIGVYPNIGYKNRQWHDVGWWQLQLQPLAEPQKMTIVGT